MPETPEGAELDHTLQSLDIALHNALLSLGVLIELRRRVTRLRPLLGEQLFQVQQHIATALLLL
jgi:hypothetical protein